MSRLILYFTVGYPDRATFGNFVSSLSSDSVDYVEFGFPSRDPKYDGPLIRKTHSIAEYEGNGDYSSVFRHIIDAGIRAYSLAYVSDIIDDFSGRISFLKDTGFSGVLMPDLLIDYFSRSDELISRVHEAGLEVIPFFNPSTPDRVIMKVAGMTHSWVYYGVQPSTGIVMPMDMKEVVERIRTLLPDREINFGFGIRSIAQASEIIHEGGDGVAIGSAFISMLESRDIKGFSDYISSLRGAVDAN
ncbi:MAG: tryptophan synthase subunit alpha [Candidatus Thermoplasmatota archaeon]|jgi:tryptophan synthase alpha chain|nr:tryptophan synthase subunit alpha [Candidatus Thermoplasmatota archaeon]